MEFEMDDTERRAVDDAVLDYREHFIDPMTSADRKDAIVNEFRYRLLGALHIGGDDGPMVFVYYMPDKTMPNPRECVSFSHFEGEALKRFRQIYPWRFGNKGKDLWCFTMNDRASIVSVIKIEGELIKNNFPCWARLHKADCAERMMLTLGFEKAEIRFRRHLKKIWNFHTYGATQAGSVC